MNRYYFKIEILISNPNKILNIENDIKESFDTFNIIKVKGDYMTIELIVSYDDKFDIEDVESFVYVKLESNIEFHEIIFIKKNKINEKE